MALELRERSIIAKSRSFGSPRLRHPTDDESPAGPQTASG